jgi:hypothetical protein
MVRLLPVDPGQSRKRLVGVGATKACAAVAVASTDVGVGAGHEVAGTV